MTTPTTCLATMKCPKCGHNADFNIEATCLATVVNDSVDSAIAYNWDDHNSCRCGGCQYQALVGDFQGANVSNTFCQTALLGDTSHPRIGAVYALMRQASFHDADVTGLYIGQRGIEVYAGENAYLQLPSIDESLLKEVLGDPTLRGKTFHFVPKGGLANESMVVLSTGHLPQVEIDEIMRQLKEYDATSWVIGAQHDFGFFLNTGITECPLPWLRNVLNLMRNAGYIWVLFNAEGEVQGRWSF